MLITDPAKLAEFGTARRIWQGIPGIACTKKGRLFVSFYSGMNREQFGNYGLVIMGNTDGCFSDAPVYAVKKEGKARVFDLVLWIDPLGRLWLIWNVQPGEEVWGAICNDPDAETLIWGEEFYIGRGVMMNKPTVLSTGEWLFPIAQWLSMFHRTYRVAGMREDDVPGSYVYKTTDNGKNFHKIGGADVRNRSCDEHMILEQENGVLSMLVRTKYGIGISHSYDRGRNWSQGEDSGLGGPCSRFFIARLRSGRILLINHTNLAPESRERTNLTALLSEDDGKSFPYSLLLDARNQVTYPDAQEAEDGSIYITYDRERGVKSKCVEDAYQKAREILVARITERDIINGRLVSPNSYLAKIANKLGALSDEADRASLFAPAFTDRDFATELLHGEKNEVIAKIFERYPLNSADFENVDFKKIDQMIANFDACSNVDVEQLEKMIAAIRDAASHAKEPSPIINRVEEYISHHLTEESTVASIAKAMQISVYYLAHLFKETTGTTLTEYRNELRITQAKKLLITTEKSINTIAQECGFCSASYLSEVFSNAEQISPSEYRTLHKVI